MGVHGRERVLDGLPYLGTPAPFDRVKVFPIGGLDVLIPLGVANIVGLLLVLLDVELFARSGAGHGVVEISNGELQLAAIVATGIAHVASLNQRLQRLVGVHAGLAHDGSIGSHVLVQIHAAQLAGRVRDAALGGEEVERIHWPQAHRRPAVGAVLAERDGAGHVGALQGAAGVVEVDLGVLGEGFGGEGPLAGDVIRELAVDGGGVDGRRRRRIFRGLLLICAELLLNRGIQKRLEVVCGGRGVDFCVNIFVNFGRRGLVPIT